MNLIKIVVTEIPSLDSLYPMLYGIGSRERAVLIDSIVSECISFIQRNYVGEDIYNDTIFNNTIAEMCIDLSLAVPPPAVCGAITRVMGRIVTELTPVVLCEFPIRQYTTHITMQTSTLVTIYVSDVYPVGATN